MLHTIYNPYVSKNLKREPAIMAKLNHPNIVSLHEVVSVTSPGGSSALHVCVGHCPFQVLGYLKSPKGTLGKTAGCFNLLAKDVTTQLQPAALLDQVNIEQMAMEL